MSKLYLQNIVNDFSFDNLPIKWQNFEFGKFSDDKTLYDFQQEALKNALKALYLFYKEKDGDKKLFFEQYQANGLAENFDYSLKRKQDSKTIKEYLLEYDNDYPVTDKKISFAHFINRMSFWMATGSGKTLIIVKLIELLNNLMRRKEIPQNDILFLAHRDDLLDQFKEHIEEFNSFNFETKINLKSLKEYESVKRENALPFAKNEITVFYYRSDLISDIQKEKIVNFRNYDNNGEWYILLDEAHKGDKDDSKRQIFYSILSRNGFLFNFSATFTDSRDFATCVFNFNLSKFIEEGYGKHIYISNQEVTAFRDNDDFSKIEKQKIVLKTLILLAYINKYFEKIKRKDKSLYHRPLLLTLVNSVNTQEADLKLFFFELEKIAKDGVEDNLLREAKTELITEIEDNPRYEFENLRVEIDKNLLSKLVYKDILKYVFNAKTSGNIEVLKIPGNKNEIIFKLQTSEKPFGLIKIGDISGWLKDTLGGYEIIESFENESVFRRVNRDDSEINILMGSRSFYEGWDSNRPNIILFVNIGVGKDAKKFVLQSVGRGVRIEPLKNKRRRILNLFNAKEIEKGLFNKVKQYALPLESLFVFGTNVENLKEIIKTLKEEKKEKDLGQEFIVNKEAEKHLLLILVYRESDKIFAEEKRVQKYNINKQDFDLANLLFDYLGEKIALVKYDCPVKVLKKTKESFEQKERYFDFSETKSISDPDLVLGRILDYFNIKDREFDKFKQLEDEIVHFKRIKFKNGGKYEELKKKINIIKQFPKRQEELDKQYGRIPREEFTKKQMSLFDAQSFELNNKKIKIKYLANHYYHPLIISNEEKIDYLNHIIDVESEVKFIEQLEDYLQKEDNIFKQFDWWMFSKLDETLDDVYIPYYNLKENNIVKFKPDFIFWLQKGDNYIISFVDPKGTSFAGYQHKIDGYKRLFENKEYFYNNIKVAVKLFLYTSDIAQVGEGYRQYWFDNFDDFVKGLVP